MPYGAQSARFFPGLRAGGGPRSPAPEAGAFSMARPQAERSDFTGNKYPPAKPGVFHMRA
ncbi:MAG: hypothetical protein DBY17_06900 [Oscillospiraceae bacterium]|nr:MAG: hypothetical protein DBY17_06900 [Oscillospiraceae bacterium]